MCRQIPVVLEPPSCGPGKDQVLSPLRVELPEMSDRLHAVGWVMTRVHRRLGLREVPCSIPVDTNQLFVTFAHDQHDRPGRDMKADAVANLLDEFPIAFQ